MRRAIFLLVLCLVAPAARAWTDFGHRLVGELPEFERTATWHYVRIHDPDCVFDRARDCRDDACVVGAIGRYAAVLGDASRPRAQRAEFRPASAW